jgi:hypothetical protein
MSQTDDEFSFSDAESRGLSAILDTLIPPSEDGRLPGAGEAGLVAYVEELVGKSPELGPMLRQGIECADALARERGAESFASLPGEDRTTVLNATSEGAPGLVPSLTFHIYSRYYREPQVMQAIGLEPRPPHPKGYEIGPSDMSKLLAPVVARGKVYRKP